MKIKYLIIASAFSLCFQQCAQVLSKQRTVTAECEYMQDALGIDTPSPRFSWKIQSNENGTVQTAYRLMVAKTKDELEKRENLVWDSGNVSDTDQKTVYVGAPLVSNSQYFWCVEVMTDKKSEPVSSPIYIFETAKLSSNDWTAKWISDDKDKEVEEAPMLRKSFSLEKKNPVQARLYVSATGYYEAFINGKRVGENYLDPGNTHYDRRNLYVTHDVTSLLSESGNNVIAAVLGNGFANCQSKAVWNFEKARWRNRPALLCELRITYDDGSVQIINSDQSWRTATGPYTYNNIYSGDRYDETLDMPGWNTAKFDDSSWEKAVSIPSPSPILEAQTMPAIRINDELQPQLLKNIGDTVYVYDMGKNIAGFCRLKVKDAKGVRFTLRHGELLKQDGTLEPGNIDVYYRPEKPGEVFQCDEFTAATNGEELYTPQFTYHGFRYVQVHCSKPITLDEHSLRGLHVHTALKKVGDFSCSNELLNKIYQATCLSYVNNCHSIPTDCPQREKNGWTCDAWVSADLGLLNYDGIKFYEKWMTDFIDNQLENGDISGIIPTYDWGYGDWPGPVWDAALFFIPDALYRYYGDTCCIARLYPTMERYMKMLQSNEKDGGFLTYGLGDWVYWKDQTNTEYTSTLFYYNDCMMMAHFARLLGKDSAYYDKKAELLRNSINRKFFNAENATYAGGTQTAQAVALYYGIVPADKELEVAWKLHEVVAENDYFLNFGLLGSKTVLPMLTKYGYVEDAYRMATKTETPSWGYQIKQGYTTLGETWVMNTDFHDASLDHVFLGDIIAWMQNTLAGINITEPGCRHLSIKPHFVSGLNFAQGSYNSVLGEVKSSWKRHDKGITLSVTIPVGATATVEANDLIKTINSGVHTFEIKE